MSNIELIIQRFIDGNATPEEEKILYYWLKENPDNRKLLFREKDLWQASRMGSQRLKEVEFDQWFELQEQMIAGKIKFNYLKEALRIAAIVIVALGAGWLGHYLYSAGMFSEQQVEMKQVEATPGQITEIFLADGTRVWLNSGSQLSFPSGFSAANREIEFSGEAFFKVTVNEGKPFLVKTRNYTVKVTGTRFNVCEYPESGIIETTIEEGKVKIITGNFIRDLNIQCQEEKLNNERIRGTLRRHKPLDQLLM
jgi:transmembrane sensor